jgi:DNA-binding transcriptional LysR family regulator
MLDLRRLRLLSELSRRGTIAEVARVVGYTPSAVSQSLAKLEREVSVTLLERDGRHVRLTPAARRLAACADRVLDELDAAEAELAAEQQTVRGEIVIGAFPSAAARLVAPAVVELAESHPELRCTTREHEPEDGIPLLRSCELDVLVTESYEGVDPAATGGLDSHPLLSEPLVLVLPSADGRDEAVPLETLSDAPWVTGLAGTQFAAALERAWHSAGFSPHIVHRADEAFLIESLVGSGLGIALLPALACSSSEDVRYARPIPAAPCRQIFALVRHGAARRPALAATLEALVRRGATESARTAADAP